MQYTHTGMGKIMTRTRQVEEGLKMKYHVFPDD